MYRLSHEYEHYFIALILSETPTTPPTCVGQTSKDHVYTIVHQAWMNMVHHMYVYFSTISFHHMCTCKKRTTC